MIPDVLGRGHDFGVKATLWDAEHAIHCEVARAKGNSENVVGVKRHSEFPMCLSIMPPTCSLLYK